MIKLTVALPMFNAKHIGWLALESLVRQQDVPVEWELVIAEEQDKNCFGEASAQKYGPRLEAAGCSRITYIPLKEWVPLSQKWRLMGQVAASTSEVYSVQAADDFSFPTRLAEAWQGIAQEGYDWIGYPILAVYIIPTREVFFVNYRKRAIPHPAGMLFSTRAEYARRLPLSKKCLNIDGWFFYCVNILAGVNKGLITLPSVKERVRSIVVGTAYQVRAYAKVKMFDGDSWRHGFGTHGFHNISTRRYGLLQKSEKDACSKEHWPEGVMSRLESLRSLTRI